MFCKGRPQMPEKRGKTPAEAGFLSWVYSGVDVFQITSTALLLLFLNRDDDFAGLREPEVAGARAVQRCGGRTSKAHSPLCSSSLWFAVTGWDVHSAAKVTVVRMTPH